MEIPAIHDIFENAKPPRAVAPLFILEMANNHMGDVEHGLRIIRECAAVAKDYPEFRCAVKFQYRTAGEFVHPDFAASDHRLIRRFMDTLLSEDQYLMLRDELREHGMVAICTPWDDRAVDLIVRHGYDILKIPSCYFNDWPLLEKIVTTDLPLIASTAGAPLEEIDKVVSFFQHRNKRFALMHCVGEYPTSDERLQLNQIDLLKQRYAPVPVGFSTHESPDNLESIKVAIAKGSSIFEKHVGVRTERYALNAYSATPEQVRHWFEAARRALTLCGLVNQRPEPTAKERQDLRTLHRGVYAKGPLAAGARLTMDNVFFAMPNVEGQLVANDFSKYRDFTVQQPIPACGAVMQDNLAVVDLRGQVADILPHIRSLLQKSGVKLPHQVEMEISHHYGIDRFYEHGAVILNIFNREYCKKLIILVAGQKYPSHFHKVKDETMHVLYGDMLLASAEGSRELRAGDWVTMEREKAHSFTSRGGLILEEISTRYHAGDSYWEDPAIAGNERRKTYLTYWSDFTNALTAAAHPE
jgi:sialic acid synthase SpsE/quercetin dioxygenase-like cupin family protein